MHWHSSLFLNILYICLIIIAMAPVSATEGFLYAAKRTAVAAGPDLIRLSSQHLMRRSLTVNHTQGVTLGVIAAYTVIIALLWNLPYVRWSLWPFKVSWDIKAIVERLLTRDRCSSLLSTNSDTRSRLVVLEDESSPYLLIQERAG